MKKLFALVLVVAMALTCAAAFAESYTIYLITMDLEDTHWVSVNEGALMSIAEARGSGMDIHYVWTAPTTGKVDAEQIECISSAYVDNADVILLASCGPETEVATIEECNAGGTKFVYVDSPANAEVALRTLSTDNFAAGAMAGETLLAALTDAGITEGRIGIIGVNDATVSTANREAGFRSVFEGTNFELPAPVYADGDAARSQDAAANFISSGVVALFGTNEGSTVGVGNAIAAAGRNGSVLGIGFDQSNAILNLVVNGSLIATAAQNPYRMGYEGVKTALKYLIYGTEEFEDVDTGITMLTADYILENGLL